MFALFISAARPSAASTAFGDLNNFDVFNDTSQPCYGFEIELEGIHSTDITYTYDWNHYGPPVITEDNIGGISRVFVRYAAKYTSAGFSAFTAVPTTAPSPTNGHMCTDPTVNFGCEHFGVGYYGAPSVVKYNWLIEDPFSPGNLIHGPAVNVSTPNWNYIPPPAVGQPAQVQAVILAPPPPPAPVYEFGDAVWVKSIVTTSHNSNPVELKDLVSDDPDNPNDVNWANGEPAEVEIEWQILQTEFNNPNGANNDLAGAAEDLPNGDEVVTRRYEFYKYAGPLDTETNEAKCDKYPPISNPADPAYDPNCTDSILGEYIGSQMAGFNVEAILGLIDHVPDGDLASPYTPRTVVVGGNTPYVSSVTDGALPPGLDLDSETGVLSGAPSASGMFSFTITASDADSAQVSKAYTMTVSGPADLCLDVVCPAPDACHEAGVCDPDTGQCSNPNAPDGTACNDGDACTQTDSCVAGSCTGSNPVTCAASDACHVAGVCDPSSGQCSNPNAPDGTACNDGDACTQTDSCVAGSCTGSNPVTCAASDACHEAGVCDPSSGQCSNPNAPDGTACSDGDACTQTDSCVAGSCTGSNPVTCAASDACHVAGVCDPSSGQCSNPNAPDGTACNDGDACTQTDSCVAGTCTGIDPVICPASDVCHQAGVCDPNSGQCSNPNAPDGTACNDSDACTQTDSCVAGTCTGSNPVTCSASDACHQAGVCDPNSGQCSNPNAPDGTACSDGDACTLDDACLGGICTSGSPDPTCTSADLSLWLKAMPKRVRGAKDIGYVIRVRNFGPSDATAVVVEMTCSGLPHQVIKAADGCVTDAGVTRCALGTVHPRAPVKTSIDVDPTGTGVLTCTARVSSATPDPNMANQSKTVTTPVH